MSISQSIKKILRSKSMSLILVTAVIVVFFYLNNPNYLSGDNIRGIMISMSVSAIIGVGMAFLLMGGGINLGAAAEGCFGAALISLLMRGGVAWPLALLLGLLFGICAGAINSFFINKLNFMGFITTLGMASVYSGLALVFTKNNSIPISAQTFWQIGSFAVFGFFPMPFVIMVCLVLIYGFILTKTRFGRSVLMCGGNRAAARLAGLSPKRISTILYMNCGMLSTLAGAVYAARMHAASPSALSTGTIDAITSSVLGGVSFMGGGGSITGMFFGALLLNVFSNGLTVVGMDAYWQLVLQGAVLIVALCVDYYSSKAKAASLKKASIRSAV